MVRQPGPGTQRLLPLFQHVGAGLAGMGGDERVDDPGERGWCRGKGGPGKGEEEQEAGNDQGTEGWLHGLKE